MLLVTVSLSFVWWSRKWLTNILFVLAPASILLYAVYLTHSRGALVAIVVMVAIAFRRSLRLLGSVTLAAAMAVALLLSKFTGGREVGMTGGADRLDLWSDGWEMFKQSPLYGHGFGSYVDTMNIAPHNSVILVAVELGLIGLVVWVSIFVLSFAQLNRIVTPSDGTPPDPTLRQHAVCLETALAAFLATSWFLSRAYYPPSFLLVGLVGGLVYQESVRRPGADLIPPRKDCIIWCLAASAVACFCASGSSFFSVSGPGRRTGLSGERPPARRRPDAALEDLHPLEPGRQRGCAGLGVRHAPPSEGMRRIRPGCRLNRDHSAEPAKAGLAPLRPRLM